jgi:hypothetical protein
MAEIYDRHTAVLIAVGLTADRMGIPKIATSDSRDVKVPAVEGYTCHRRPGATWAICEKRSLRDAL